MQVLGGVKLVRGPIKVLPKLVAVISIVEVGVEVKEGESEINAVEETEDIAAKRGKIASRAC